MGRVRRRGRGCGIGGRGGEGEGCLTSAAADEALVGRGFLTWKLDKAAARPTANDGCFNLTKVRGWWRGGGHGGDYGSADEPGAREYSAVPRWDGFTARAQCPPLEEKTHCSAHAADL